MSDTQIVHTPTGTFAIVTLVADRLLEAGHITRNAEGDLTAPDATILQQQTAALGVCDFCSVPVAPHVVLTPDFPLGDEMTGDIGVSTGGGWAACDTCYDLVSRNARAELLRRAIDHHKVTGRFSAAALAGLHKRFWNAREEMIKTSETGVAIMDFIDNRPPVEAQVQLPSARNDRVAYIRKMTGLTDDEITALVAGDMTYKNVSKKLAALHRQLGSERQTRQMLERMELDMRRPLPPGHVPHWQQAVDARFSTLTTLQQILSTMEPFPYHQPEAIDLKDPAAIRAVMKKAELSHEVQQLDFRSDTKFLGAADTYSFNAETIAAIQAAAESIPHDSPLSSIETPNTGAGWFWFSAPLDIKSSSVASDQTVALLWGWDTLPPIKTPTGMSTRQPVIRFSAFVRDDKHVNEGMLQGKVLPSVKWYWPLTMTFHDMIGLATLQHRDAYGPGGPHEGRTGVSETETITAIADLSLFFLAACVWFKQKILVSAPGHIERHARKRYVKEHKLKESPTVQVIALRASLRDPAEPRAPGEEHAAREWHWRWVVRGHPRLQPCGPGRADKKLIWIDAFVKGPDDKPLRTREKVYAVIR